MKHGTVFKEGKQYWVACPPYTTEGVTYDSIGPYTTKADAKTAWTSLAKSVGKWDKDYGKGTDVASGSSEPVRTDRDPVVQDRGLGPVPESKAERNGGTSDRSGERPAEAELGDIRHAGRVAGVETHAIGSECDLPGPDEHGGDVLSPTDLRRTTHLSEMIGAAFSFL